MPRPAEFWPSNRFSPGRVAALTPTTAYFEATVTAGKFRWAGAVKSRLVPFGRLTRVHCMSKDHSMVRPLTTDASAATSWTAVQARDALKVAAIDAAATIALNMMAVPPAEAPDAERSYAARPRRGNC